MWFIYILATSIFIKSIKASAPICGLNCLHIVNSTGDFTVYIINGTPVTLYRNESQLQFNCDNNKKEYNYLPKNEKNIIIYSNCTFTSMTINSVTSQLNINSDYLVLEEWKPKESEIFTNIKVLRILKINKSNITHILPNFITEIEELKEFHFTNGNVTLDENIKLPPNLKLLNLTNNNIYEVPELIQNTSALEIVILSKNSLKNMPSITNAQIKVLDLSFNNLLEIETNLLRNLSSLKKLFLNDNSINKLEEEMFRNLINLMELHLQYNTIEVLPKYIFDDLSKLQILNISHNRLNAIQPFAFPGRSGNLYNLDLSYNQLLSNDLCPPGESRLNGLSNLTFLNISHNNLDVVCASWTNYYSLKSLDLSYNRIDNVTEEEFYFQNPHITVDFRHNRMTSIIFTDSKMDYKNRKYYLSGNNIICDGYLSWFIKTAKVNNLFENNFEDTQCFGPKHLENRTLSSLEYDELFLVIECEKINSSLINCICNYEVLEHQLTLNCSHLENPPIESYNTSSNVYKVVLVLEHCNLKSFPKYFPKNLTELHLAHNSISHVPEIPEKIVHLDLSFNNLSYMSYEETQQIIAPQWNRTVRLSNNILPCDCRNGDFLTAVIEYSYLVLDISTVRCDSGAELSRNPFCGRRGWILVVVCTLGIILTICAALCAVYYKYRLGIKATLFTHGFFLPFLYVEDLEKEKPFDAFVSYAHGDEQFIISELLPKLETEYQFKLCIHHRDWPVGIDIPSQILTSVENSRRTIVILSKNFLNSVWGKAEFRAGIAETYRTGTRRVIIVKLQDAGDLSKIDDELITYIKSNVFIERNDPFFWQKLCFALPHKRYKKIVEPLPLSKSEEKKRMKRIQPIAEFVDREFAKLDNNSNIDDIVELKDGVEIKTNSLGGRPQ